MKLQEKRLRRLVPKTTQPSLPFPVETKLFAIGATVGPLVDGLHNQSLLRYPVAPINVPWPVSHDNEFSLLLATSWVIPPLLGIAYVVLGSLLPTTVRYVREKLPFGRVGTFVIPRDESVDSLRVKAVLAVVSTALVIKVSDYLVTHPDCTSSFLDFMPDYTQQHVFVLMILALTQWRVLDRTKTGLLVASMTAFGGPLSEIPFVLQGLWTYLPSVQDYFPLADFTDATGWSNVGLAGITGPCYFAVALDAMSLGRYFTAATMKK